MPVIACRRFANVRGNRESILPSGTSCPPASTRCMTRPRERSALSRPTKTSRTKYPFAWQCRTRNPPPSVRADSLAEQRAHVTLDLHRGELVAARAPPIDDRNRQPQIVREADEAEA